MSHSRTVTVSNQGGGDSRTRVLARRLSPWRRAQSRDRRVPALGGAARSPSPWPTSGPHEMTTPPRCPIASRLVPPGGLELFEQSHHGAGLAGRRALSPSDSTKEDLVGRPLVSDEHGIRTITFNRPEILNALTLDDLSAIREAVAGADGSVRGLVLTGAGGRAFSPARTSTRSPTPLPRRGARSSSASAPASARFGSPPYRRSR
jgi:hypothetical protein